MGRGAGSGVDKLLRWKVSLPVNLVMYLLYAVRVASRASLEAFSFSYEMMWMQKGNTWMPFFFMPTS
ncbi:hypothetical protein ACFX15_029367 [Malus domestica]